MIDKEKIRRDLNKYFMCGGKITIDDHTGKVSVTGNVKLKQNIKHTQLPVQFATVSGDFACNYNTLTSLTGAPHSVSGYFDCRGNSLTTLAGAPQSVGGHFDCYSNKLTTLTGSPHSVGGYFDCSSNKLISLIGVPASASRIYCDYTPDMGLLRLVLYNYTIDIFQAPEIVTAIIKKYSGRGQSGALAAAAELIRAGFKGNAKL